ncbi:PP2C family protein-serine/threonine phosphatase, partial [Streptomyces sp. NPDC059506]|uniref:PP2C family protein-serine/threonine phosphatase n=1 Tax=Streptomyces sp. NPDC059506 TaxID=3347751 RepID=UPI0036867CF7
AGAPTWARPPPPPRPPGRGGRPQTSARHPAPLILRGDGRVEEAETRGTLIGVVPSVTSTTWETVLEPGETCLLFSDGVTEARGGASGNEMFGTQRLSGALAECARMPVRAVVERVEMLTAQWLGGNEHDDIALLAVGAPRGSHLTAVDGTGRGRYTG